MKYIQICIIIFVFSLLVNLRAQNTVSQIEKLELGFIVTEISLYSSDFSTCLWGRSSNDQYYPFFNPFENPAFLAGEKHSRLLFHISPEQKAGLTLLLNVSEKINQQLDDKTLPYRSESLKLGYPQVNLHIARKMNIPEGMIAVPFRKFFIGFIFHYPLHFSMQNELLGIESSVSTELHSGGGTNKVMLNNYLDAVNQVHYSIISTNFLIGRQFRKDFFAGLQIERLHVNLDVFSYWNIEGSMFYNGKEHLFNNAATLWHTDITQHLEARYEGNGWRLNWGCMYLYNYRWVFDGSISLASDLHLKGELSGKRNKIPALNMEALISGGGGEEILDPEKLDPSQLTYTEDIGWNVYSSLKHTLTNQVKIGIFYNRHDWKFYLSDRFYFGNVRMQYGKDLIQFSIRQKLNFYLSKKNFYLNMGALIIEAFSPDTQDFAINTNLITIPKMTIGYGKNLTKVLFLVGAIDILPIPGVHFAVQYQF